MVCSSCKNREHEKCRDLPRRTAAKKGEIIGMTDPMASRWCDCGCITETNLALKLGVKSVSE
jgi:hypothetical protein